MRCGRFSVVTLLAMVLSALTVAGAPPEPVSPGSSERIERIASPCPTFSWAGPPGAVGIRVAVYAIPADESAPPTLVAERALPAAASSWTPALPDCLAPGTYAWGVGALTAEGGPFWSEAAWFEVVPAGGALAGVPGAPGTAPRDGAVTPGAGTTSTEADSSVRGRVEARTPSAQRLLATYFSVGSGGAVTAGPVTATSFSGDGSGLTNLTAANIGAGTAGIDISGNAATASNISGLANYGVLFAGGSANVVQDASDFYYSDGANLLYVGGAIAVPATSNINTGVYRIGSNRFAHAYGTGNAFLGIGTGNFALTGTSNTAVGNFSMVALDTGTRNTAVGGWSAGAVTVGNNNTAVGAQALYTNTAGSQNTAVGTYALYDQAFSNGGAAWSADNTAVGYMALYNNEPADTATGVRNTAVGSMAMYQNTLGRYNTALGVMTLYNNTTGDENVAVGNNAMISNTTAGGNTAVGFEALKTQSYSNSDADWNSFNTAVGYKALNLNLSTTNDNGRYNTALGALALLANTTGYENTAVGMDSLKGNTTGHGNTAVGFGALKTQSCCVGDPWESANTAVGTNALEDNQPTTTDEGKYNTAVGHSALLDNITGASNTALGIATLMANTSGDSNIAVGAMAGSALTTGDYNIAIGNAGTAGESGTIRIGDTSQTRAFMTGIYDVTPSGETQEYVVIDSNGQLGSTGTPPSTAPREEAAAALSADVASLQKELARERAVNEAQQHLIAELTERLARLEAAQAGQR